LESARAICLAYSSVGDDFAGDVDFLGGIVLFGDPGFFSNAGFLGDSACFMDAGFSNALDFGEDNFGEDDSGEDLGGEDFDWPRLIGAPSTNREMVTRRSAPVSAKAAAIHNAGTAGVIRRKEAGIVRRS
jgi:hypothetical protein